MLSIWTSLKYCRLAKCKNGLLYPLYPFSNDKFQTLPLKTFADDNSKFDEMAKSSPKGWKILWEKGKLLVMSTFSFSHNRRGCLVA